MITLAPRRIPEFCFGILTDYKPWDFEPRTERAWACCKCKAITTAASHEVCALCGHVRCHAPLPSVYARNYR